MADGSDQSASTSGNGGAAAQRKWGWISGLEWSWFHSWLGLIPVVGIIGIAVILVFSTQVAHETQWEVFATGVGIAAAAALTGGLVGFLFGIPRTIDAKSAADTTETQYAGNTNLEQVSDWLTKILVGVGLVQLARAPGALKSLAHSLQAPLGNLSSSGAFGLAIAITYAVLGFLFLYMWARVRMVSELHEADAFNRLLQQSDKVKASALTIVGQQLSPQNTSPPTQDVLNEAVAAAPLATRFDIFGQAERIRSSTWNDASKKALLERTIPVFRALTSADTDNTDYRSHGSLGWALKDQTIPNWTQAKSELTTAIAIRDRLGVDGWALFEANRALCNIKLNPNQDPAAPDPEALVAVVNHDLLKASADLFAAPMLASNPDLASWIEKHPLTTAAPAQNV